MLRSWLQKRHRRRILATPMPAAWLLYLHQNVGVYALLSDTQRAQLNDDVRIFLAEKKWEGCGGLTITDEIKVTIAAQACLLLLGIEHDYFSSVETILVYPSPYRSPEGQVGPGGIVHEDATRAGEAWYRGPVVLDWESVLAGGRNPRDGYNVVLHEFAHQLDFLDGVLDGTPPLRDQEQYRQWQEVMTTEYARLVGAAQHGEPTVLDEYGATNPAEFFAVATECFFEKPAEMQGYHKRLYKVLREYYCQDPIVWFAPELTATPKAPVPTAGAELPEALPGQPQPGRPRRGSRRPPGVERSDGITSGPPGWVLFWIMDAQPPRLQAIARVRGLLWQIALLFLVGMAAAVAASRVDVVVRLQGESLATIAAPILRRPPGMSPLEYRRIATLALGLAAWSAVEALWVWLAIRWTDRHGGWNKAEQAALPAAAGSRA